MSLESVLNDLPHGRVTKQCRLSIWLGTLNEDDRASFWKAMDNEAIPTRHIWRSVKEFGCPNQESSIRSHRRGECQTCERKSNGLNV